MTIQKILLKYLPKKENLLPFLKEINVRFGFISKEAVKKAAQYFDLKPAAVFSAASFYSELRFKSPVALKIKVCDSTNCGSKEAEKVLREAERFLGVKAGDDFSSKVEISRESCFGLCDRGPVVEINGTIFEKMTPEKVDDVLKAYFS